MSTDLTVVESGAGFHEVPWAMSENGVRRLPVRGDDGELAGIVSVDDLNELPAEPPAALGGHPRTAAPVLTVDGW